MSWAKVGAKCVCIRDTSRGHWNGLAPVEGETYVVTSPWRNGPFGEEQATFSTLDGRPIHDGFGVLTSRFRPLETKTIEQDVQMFKRIAETVPSLEDAE